MKSMENPAYAMHCRLHGKHIRYRKNLGHTVEGLVTLCVQYEMYLD